MRGGSRDLSPHVIAGFWRSCVCSCASSQSCPPVQSPPAQPYSRLANGLGQGQQCAHTAICRHAAVRQRSLLLPLRLRMLPCSGASIAITKARIEFPGEVRHPSACCHLRQYARARLRVPGAKLPARSPHSMARCQPGPVVEWRGVSHLEAILSVARHRSDMTLLPRRAMQRYV